MTQNKKLAELENSINIHFKSKKLLKNALVHRSYHNENKSFELPSNEKLEFLGDSVLSLITSEYLYKNYPDYQEGDYTDMKAAIVNTVSLGEAADALHLGDFLYLSKGEEDNNGRSNVSLLADAFEALLGAIYLEFGFDISYRFVKDHLFHNRLQKIIDEKLYLPAKNMLQEYYQDRYKRLPEYKVKSESGPEHDKTYVCVVMDAHRVLGEGEGRSKKQAEENAARAALQKLGI